MSGSEWIAGRGGRFAMAVAVVGVAVCGVVALLGADGLVVQNQVVPTDLPQQPPVLRSHAGPHGNQQPLPFQTSSYVKHPAVPMGVEYASTPERSEADVTERFTLSARAWGLLGGLVAALTALATKAASAKATREAYDLEAPSIPLLSPPQPSRRVALGALLLTPVAAEEALAFDFDLPLLGKKDEGPLPKKYRERTQKLVQALRKNLEAEATGASESEVRKAGSEIQPLIKEFLDPKWEKNSDVVADPSFKATKAAIRLIGQFYTENGSRARMTSEAREPILARLAEAEEALTAATPAAK